MNPYEKTRILTGEIPELEGWKLTEHLSIDLEGDCYHVWDPQSDKHMRLVRGTHSCSWGWGALLSPPKSGIANTLVKLAYPLVGMFYGMKDKFYGTT
jgi:hypothetical protein